jgi:hypothetical protein
MTANFVRKGDVGNFNPVSPNGVPVETSLVLQLGPACSVFAKPLEVCMYVGDTAEGNYRTMYTTSLVDCSAPAKGFGPWEALTNGTFDAATGKVCGMTAHFSLFGIMTSTVPTDGTVPKLVSAGGSCPSDCNGRGSCQQEGKCACFPGFNGLDCSMRACPASSAWGEEQPIMHAPAMCSGRGTCDTGSGECRCMAGYEGAACERMACPNGCTGHGVCTPMSELPTLKASGYKSWEVDRLQVCNCDGGYFGPDCSQRYCPFGDDPETNCEAASLYVQSMRLSFDVVPTGALVNGKQGPLSSADRAAEQMVLGFRDATGRSYLTPAFGSAWTADADGSYDTVAANLKKALVALPQFSVMDAEVGVYAEQASDPRFIEFSVTFTGTTNPGTTAQLYCPVTPAGTLGCPQPGCRPMYSQLRFTNGFEALTLAAKGVAWNPHYTLLEQPAALDEGDDQTPQMYGVAVYLTLSRVGATAADYLYTFSVTSEVYGRSISNDGLRAAASIPATPVPTEGTTLREQFPLAYGLVIDFGTNANLNTAVGVSNPLVVEFKWRLPVCSTAVAALPDPSHEGDECSNRGQCSRATGECQCFAGYTGYNCGSQSAII